MSSGTKFVCTVNYISFESLINVDFGGKNTNWRLFAFRKRKSRTTAKMTVRHSIQLIGDQIQDQALWQNNYKMLIIESVGAFLDVLIGYFLNSSALR